MPRAARKTNDDCPFQNLDSIEIKCPECGGRGFDPARGRFGPVWKCRQRPGCKFQLTSRPIGKTCSFRSGGQRCGQPMVEGTKTIPNRCSDRACPNRNPHKL